MNLKECRNLYIGNAPIRQVFVGSQLIWPSIAETLEVEPAQLTLDYRGGTASFDVITNPESIAWRVIADDPEILSHTPDSGEGNGTVDFSYSINSSAFNRLFEIGVTSATGSPAKVAMVRIKQNCASISLSSYSVSWDYLAHTVHVDVSSDGPWSVECDEDWVMLSKDVSGANIRVYDNKIAEERTAIVRFVVDGTEVSAEFSLSQEAAPSTISVSPSVFYLNHEGGDITFMVNSSAPWRVERGTSMPFVIFPSSGGAGDTEVTATVEPNTSATDIIHNLYLETNDGAASAILSVQVKTGIAVITIDRGVPRLHVLNPTATMYVESTLPWSITSSDRNISFDIYSGEADTEYQVTMTYRGPIGASGTAEITVVSGTVSSTITVRYGGL